MTLQNFLDLTDLLSPGAVDPALRLRWLGEIEGRVRVELLGESPEALSVIASDSPRDAVLAAPSPYDRLYWLHHLAMCDYLAGDAVRYENSAMMFNEAYAAYGRYLRRTGGGC